MPKTSNLTGTADSFIVYIVKQNKPYSTPEEIALLTNIPMEQVQMHLEALLQEKLLDDTLNATTSQ